MATGITIDACNPGDARWPELERLIEQQGQTRWTTAPLFEPFPRHFLLALAEGEAVGFLMFVAWEIGPHDRNMPTLVVDGKTLTEAKIIAFGVKASHRRRGIGRALQERAIERARELGCHQVRSVSGPEYGENHRLKLAMGFGVEPMERETPSYAFVLPLRRKERCS